MARYEASTPAIGNAEFFRKSRDILIEMERKLSGVVSSSEKDFLALGEGLNAFHGQSLHLADLAKNLADLTSGETMLSSLGRLSEELERMTGICDLRRSEESIAELGKVNAIIDNLEGIIVEFGRIVKKLSMLGISTRIESARLGSKGRGFSTLADDVEKLANNIVNYSGLIVQNAGALKGYVDSASKRTMGIIDTQKSCSINIFEHLKSNIDSLASMTERSAALSKGVTVKTNVISENISQAVLSMQSHDIVRQQVEHVEQAVHDMRAILEENREGIMDSGELSGQAAETVGWVGDVLQLQCSQLEHSKDRFVEAVESLLGNLRGVAESILAISGEIRELMGQEAGQEQTALAGVERGIKAVNGSLREFSREGEELGKLMAAVAETIAAMSSFVAEIEEVGSEIELIAINASIKAAHTGEEGAALGVLASAIQGLSVEARKQTDEVSGILNEISSSSEVLQRNAAGYYDNTQVEEILGSLDAIVSAVSDVDRESQERFARLREQSDRLGRSIQELSERVDFHTKVAKKLEEARESLDRSRGWAKQLVPLEKDHNRSERLKKLYERYTMETERDVHAAAFGAVPKALTGKSNESDVELFDDFSSKGGDPDDLGDNVDLF